MSYLLDTNACVALINGSPVSVRERFEREKQRLSQVFVSSVAAFELFYGAAKSKKRGENEQALARMFATFVVVLPFDADDAKKAGDIRALLESSGKPIGAYDYLIAGQAANRNLILVTANEREFRRVHGLRWENWAK